MIFIVCMEMREKDIACSRLWSKIKGGGDYYELIDSQQRLTTLYIIYHYMHTQVSNLIKKLKFSLKYKTRPEKEDFLENMALSMKEDNINFWYMCNCP